MDKSAKHAKAIHVPRACHADDGRPNVATTSAGRPRQPWATSQRLAQAHEQPKRAWMARAPACARCGKKQISKGLAANEARSLSGSGEDRRQALERWCKVWARMYNCHIRGPCSIRLRGVQNRYIGLPYTQALTRPSGQAFSAFGRGHICSGAGYLAKFRVLRRPRVLREIPRQATVKMGHLSRRHNTLTPPPNTLEEHRRPCQPKRSLKGGVAWLTLKMTHLTRKCG